jgi:3-oxoacyl-[acyl-carrier protein] reductase
MAVLSFENRVAVITGGTKNIGLAISREFLKAGMRVAIVSSNLKNLYEAEKILNSEGLYPFCKQLDLKHISEIHSVLEEVNERFGSIDVLVNNAGVLELSNLLELTEETWDEVLNINLKGAFFISQKAIKFLIKGNHPRIINLSSNAGRMGGYANGLAYSSSKGGIIALTYGMARKLARYGITVNCVAPGTIDSDMTKARPKNVQKDLIKKFPLGRIGTPKEIASAVCYFASIESGFTTGAVLDVNGGMFMG